MITARKQGWVFQTGNRWDAHALPVREKNMKQEIQEETFGPEPYQDTNDNAQESNDSFLDEVVETKAIGTFIKKSDLLGKKTMARILDIKPPRNEKFRNPTVTLLIGEEEYQMDLNVKMQNFCARNFGNKRSMWLNKNVVITAKDTEFERDGKKIYGIEASFSLPN